MFCRMSGKSTCGPSQISLAAAVTNTAFGEINQHKWKTRDIQNTHNKSRPVAASAPRQRCQRTNHTWKLVCGNGQGITHASGNYSSRVGASLAPRQTIDLIQPRTITPGHWVGAWLLVGAPHRSSRWSWPMQTSDATIHGHWPSRSRPLTGASTIDGRFRVSAVTLDAVGQLRCPGHCR